MNDPSPLRAAPPPLVMLVALSALQPIALNIIAPSTPAMAREFGTDYATVQLTLTVYLAAVALAQLVTGPWSDRVGRRPVVLFSLGCFIIGSLAASVAPTIEALIAARVVQAIGSGSTFAQARSIIRDTSTRDEAASRIGYMMVAMLVAPMLSPSIGSLIDQAAGWHAIFIAMAIAAAVSLALVWRGLPETNVTRDPNASLGKLARAFPTLLGNRDFLAYTLSGCASSAMFFSFIAGAPHVVVESMGQPPYVYAAWFIFMSLGYASGNFISGRYARRLGSARLLAIGSWVTLAAAATQGAWALWGPWIPAALFLPGFGVALGNGMTMPSATASALSIRPDIAGSASGLMGALPLLCSAGMSLVAGHVVEVAPRGIVVIGVGCAIVGVIAVMLQPRTPPR